MSTSNNRLKAEWERQQATLLCWPNTQSDWRPNLRDAESTYGEIIAQISRFQRVLCLCQDSQTQSRAQRVLEEKDATASNISFAILPTNDTWCRDYGPISVATKSGLTLLDFQFNGWGEKYDYELDDQITASLFHTQLSNQPRYQAIEYILEGGSIENNGDGLLITTSTCLLNKNRNNLSKTKTEALFAQWFGTKHTLWLDTPGLEGDDTDAHIDTLVRFIDPHHLLYQQCQNPKDPHFKPLQRLEAQLKQQIETAQLPLKLTPLPLPSPRYSTLNPKQPRQRLPASYANFLFINDALLLPTYGVAEDDLAVALFQEMCPEREIIPIDCQALIEQSGSLHCIAMQLYNTPQLTD
ncbi:MAG: agmatine deiminase [Moraxellaceae bacterium]|nr:MAG: agmatine deiminase [Moraxellaceae bacterium]